MTEPHVSISEQMVDITAPEHEVEVVVNNGVLWVNIDGVCRLRCCQIQQADLVIDIRGDLMVDIRRPGQDKIDREGHQTPCLLAIASGDACQPDETLKRCAICGFVIDTKFVAEKPTMRLRPGSVNAGT